MYLNASNGNNYCLNTCPDNYGPNNNTMTCDSCSNIVANCTECSTSFGENFECTQCSENNFLDENGQQCYNYDTNIRPINSAMNNEGVYLYCD